MEKYTDEEFIEIKKLIKEHTAEAVKKLARSVKNSEFEKKFADVINAEKFDENLFSSIYKELFERVFEKVPTTNKREFLGEMPRGDIIYLYDTELTKEYPECFIYMIEDIAKGNDGTKQEVLLQLLQTVFKFTDIRKCCKFFNKYTRNNTKRDK